VAEIAEAAAQADLTVVVEQAAVETVAVMQDHADNYSRTRQ
jgi:hypothetical protein